MMVQVVDRQETYRLISDGRGRFAVVEARCGRVYSLDAQHSREAEDGDAGMLVVVGDDGWFSEAEARACFESALRRGRRLSRVIW